MPDFAGSGVPSILNDSSGDTVTYTTTGGPYTYGYWLWQVYPLGTDGSGTYLQINADSLGFRAITPALVTDGLHVGQTVLTSTELAYINAHIGSYAIAIGPMGGPDTCNTQVNVLDLRLLTGPPPDDPPTIGSSGGGGLGPGSGILAFMGIFAVTDAGLIYMYADSMEPRLYAEGVEEKLMADSLSPLLATESELD